MRPVFVSHSSKDKKAAVRICSALEAKGIGCWIASRDVAPGENFGDAIVDAIRAAKLMLLVFTSNANNSDEIKKELVLAGHNRLIVIPVRVEDVVPGGAFAYELATRQWIDLFDDWDREIERLSRWILHTLAAAEPARPPNPAASPDPVELQVASAIVPDRHSGEPHDPVPASLEAARPAEPAATPVRLDRAPNAGAGPQGQLRLEPLPAIVPGAVMPGPAILPLPQAPGGPRISDAAPLPQPSGTPSTPPPPTAMMAAPPGVGPLPQQPDAKPPRSGWDIVGPTLLYATGGTIFSHLAIIAGGGGSFPWIIPICAAGVGGIFLAVGPKTSRQVGLAVLVALGFMGANFALLVLLRASGIGVGR